MRDTLAATAALLGFVNFFAFLGGALHFGGDAVNGMVVGDHYFVASHGKYTEVSKAVYTYSLWHVCSLAVTFPVMMGGMGYLAFRMMDVVKGPVRPKP